MRIAVNGLKAWIAIIITVAIVLAVIVFLFQIFLFLIPFILVIWVLGWLISLFKRKNRPNKGYIDVDFKVK